MARQTPIIPVHRSSFSPDELPSRAYLHGNHIRQLNAGTTISSSFGQLDFHMTSRGNKLHAAWVAPAAAVETVPQ